MIEVTVNMPSLLESGEVASRINRAQALLDTAVMQDTSPYVPFRQGTLDSSVIRATEVGSGRVVYDTPYARHMYYGVHYRTGKPFTFNKRFHPLASAQWFEHSKALNKDKWVETVKRAIE